MAFPPNFSPHGGPPASDFARDGAALFQPLDAWNSGESARSCSSSLSSTWDLPEPPSIGKALRNFRINGLFCDVALHFTSSPWVGRAGATEPSATRPPPPPLFAHKVVLAACSPYFFSELSSSESDSGGVQHVFLPADVCDDSVQFILSWMYGEGGGKDGEQKTMTKELAQAVAKTAFSFMLTELLDFLGEDGRRWLRLAALNYESSLTTSTGRGRENKDGAASLPIVVASSEAEDCVVSMEPVVKTEIDETWTPQIERFADRPRSAARSTTKGVRKKKKRKTTTIPASATKGRRGRPKGSKGKKREEKGKENKPDEKLEGKDGRLDDDDEDDDYSASVAKRPRGVVSRSAEKEHPECVVDIVYEDDDDDEDDEKMDIKTDQCLVPSNAACKFSSDPVLNACLALDPSNPTDPFGKFVCPRCDFVLVKEEVKAKARSFKKVFYRRAARHLLDHHQMVCPTLAYRCQEPDCNHIFLRKADLQVHTKKMHEGQRTTVNCDQCGKTLNCASLSYHMKNVHNKEAESRLCGICGKKFKNGILLKIHEKDAHWIGVDPSSVFRCDYGGCEFKTPWKSKFTVHMYMKHQKLLEGAVLYECDVCKNYKAPTREQVNKHKKFQHLLQKSIPCPQCDQLFKRKCHVEAHFKRVHSADKPVFICPECSHEFATSGALKEHRMREHPADGIKGRKLFRCPYCPHESFLAGNCMKHVRRIHPQFEAKYIDARNETDRRRSQNTIYAIYAEDEGVVEDVVLGSMRAAGVLVPPNLIGVQDLSTSKPPLTLDPSSRAPFPT